METYHDRYITKLNALSPVQGKDIAVLGCSFGVECRKLIEAGANSVVGIDLDPRIGKDYADPRVAYHRLPITETCQPSDTYDIVYSVAAFEHVHDLPGGMREAARICKPGGLIFILSSPIWYAPYGNHMIAKLESLPWCHLLFTPSELRETIVSSVPAFAEDVAELNRVIDRIYDPTYFNRFPPLVYKQVAGELRDVSVVDNALWPAAVKAEYSAIYLPICVSKGFVEKDLMIGAHFFAAFKS